MCAKVLMPCDSSLQARRRLDIKKDWKGVVTVFGAQSIGVSSETDLVQHMTQAVNNIPSSHDPSDASIIVSWIIEGSNNETQAVTKGRLTFFDLPGCDRFVHWLLVDCCLNYEHQNLQHF